MMAALPVLVVPVTAADRLLGVMRASRNGVNRFSNEDLAVMQVLADHVGMALDHARLYAEARSMAITDPLTGLYNRHFLDTFMGAQANQGSDHSVALLMIDLFEFKKVNDTWGHLQGDALLQDTARLLQGSVRSTSGWS